MFTVKLKLIMCWFSYCFVTSISKNFMAVQYASLVIGETAYQLIIAGKWVFTKL